MRRRLAVAGTCLWLGAIVLGVAACRSLPPEPAADPVGSVDLAIVPPPQDASRLQLDPSQAFVFPQLLDAPLPDYPQDLLALRLPQLALCVDVDIGEDGAVRRVMRRIDAQCPAVEGVHEPRFAGPLVEAAAGWRFEPALVCRTPDGRAADHACAEADAVETPVALRMSYVVVFSQQDGRAQVNLGAGRP